VPLVPSVTSVTSSKDTSSNTEESISNTSTKISATRAMREVSVSKSESESVSESENNTTEDNDETPNPKEVFSQDPDKLSKEPSLYQNFVEKINSMRSKPADIIVDSTTTTLMEPSPSPSPSPHDGHMVSKVDLSEGSADKPNFSPFTPNSLEHLSHNFK
jgi:hypothetical protein